MLTSLILRKFTQKAKQLICNGIVKKESPLEQRIRNA